MIIEYYQNLTANQLIADSFVTLIKSLTTIVTLFLLAKWMGKKQIAQLSFFDYIVGITIGSIGGDLCTADTPHLHLLSMVTFACVSVLISKGILKSIRMRRFMVGTPTVLIDDGKILTKALKEVNIDINELISECRIAGYYDVSNILSCTMETSGKFSFLPRSDSTPLTASDMGITKPPTLPLANVIIDKKIMPDNLKAIGRDADELISIIESKDYTLNDVALCTMDTKGNVEIYPSDTREPPRYYD